MNAFEVRISAYITVHVARAKDAEEAQRLAREEADLGDMTFDESTAEEISDAVEIERSRRHADKTVEA